MPVRHPRRPRLSQQPLRNSTLRDASSQLNAPSDIGNELSLLTLPSLKIPKRRLHCKASSRKYFLKLPLIVAIYSEFTYQLVTVIVSKRSCLARPKNL